MKKNKSGGLGSLMFNLFFGAILGFLCGMPVLGMAANTLAGLVPRMQGVAFSGVNKEIWIDTIMEGFYPTADWLNGVVDMSAFVENNTINLADAGVDPNVLINNTSFPIAVAARTDAAIAIALETLDSENTVVRNVEEMEAAYDKRSSVTRQHQSAIYSKARQRAIFNYAPAGDSTYTPVFAASGGTDAETTYKKLALADMTKMSKKFNAFDAPEIGRVAVLTPQHLQNILDENITLYNQYVNLPEGKPLRFAGWDIYSFSKNPVFNKTTLAKKAWGAAAAPTTDSMASVFFCKSEVMKADGTWDMFLTEKDPLQRGDIIGFQKRFIATSIRSKAVGAIVSSTP